MKKVNSPIVEDCLDYQNVTLTDIPNEDMECRDPKRIKVLGLVNNGIHSAPGRISSMSSLEMLRIISNPIEFLPEYIFKLQNLKFLAVTKCKLSHIPGAILGLHNLRFLKMSHNKIEYVSPCIFYLPKLSYIDLDQNLIKGLPMPEDISVCQKTVSLIGNPIQEHDGPAGLLGRESLRIVFGINMYFTEEDKQKIERPVDSGPRGISNRLQYYGLPLAIALLTLLLCFVISICVLFMSLPSPTIRKRSNQTDKC